MKKTILFLLFAVLLLSLSLSYSQGVGINTKGAPANPSAILDVSSQTQGLLLPRMTTQQRNLILSPLESLLIFNTDSNCFQSYNGTKSQWVSIACPKSNNTAICGTQVWMSANLNIGTQVLNPSGNTIGQTVLGEKWCWGDIPANCTTYGGLYEWASAMNIPYTYNTNLSNIKAADKNCDPCGPTTGHGGVQGICPSGYHIPSDLEWSRFEFCTENDPGNYSLSYFQTTAGWRGGLVGAYLKVGNSYNPEWDGINSSGFAAVDAGDVVPPALNSTGAFYYGGKYAYMWQDISAFWTVTETSAANAWYHVLETGSTKSERNNGYTKTAGFSVRCLKD